MARRDLTKERTEQILDAFERCILSIGLEGSSLERVADEAGMKRPIIRHYVGNRDQLLTALTNRLVEKFRSESEAMIQTLGSGNRVKKLVNHLIGDKTGDSAQLVQIFEHLILSAAKDETVRKLLADSVSDFVALIERELIDAYPDSKGHAEVAFGIVSIYFNHISLLPLQLPAAIQNDGRKAIFRLIDTLTI